MSKVAHVNPAIHRITKHLRRKACCSGTTSTTSAIVAVGSEAVDLEYVVVPNWIPRSQYDP